MDKLVSVIMPVYNVEKSYLVTAIESILNQTYPNIELIIIDSSDKNDVKKYFRMNDKDNSTAKREKKWNF